MYNYNEVLKVVLFVVALAHILRATFSKDPIKEIQSLGWAVVILTLITHTVSVQ